MWQAFGLYQAAEKLCFVSGHDFSRAVNDSEYVGLLAPEVYLSCLVPSFSAAYRRVPHPSRSLRRVG
jgi:hypothetical protein